MSRNAAIGLGLCAALLLLSCCCLVVLGAAGGLWFYQQTSYVPPLFTANPPLFPAATDTPRPAARLTPVPPASATAAGLDPATLAAPDPAADDLAVQLARTTMEARDLRLLAQRIKGIPDIPETVADRPADHAVGAELEFSVSNDDLPDPNFTLTARLVYKTENVYFFAERGVDVDPAEVQALVDDFQNQTYPTNRAFFGEEWNPGVDGDPRLYILFARGLGFSLLGYYYPVDEYSRLAYPYSNEKEIFYINADTTGPGDPDLASTLAHEFQHMIHWRQDRNEDIWFNEGASMLAELLNGYRPRSYAVDFVAQPDLQLSTWTDGDSIPHYGAAYMFLAYFLDRFGEAATRALMAHPANGLLAVDQTLAERGLTDPLTGRPLTADDVLADWSVANFLNDPTVGDGRYAYQRFVNAPTADPNDAYRRCPAAEDDLTVSQHGVDYYALECPGQWTLTFTGAARVPVVPADPLDGRRAFWTNRGDESVSNLTRTFDLSGLTTATLEYAAWWDIEEDYDYAYLEVSRDGGQTWELVRAPGMTDSNTHGANFGWGYTGDSGAWQTERVDLSAYAGQVVQVRFEYITDAGLNFNGLLVDDVRVPELGYRADFEVDDGGWTANGFVRLENSLPQRFAVQVLRQSGGQTSVEWLALDERNAGQTTLTLQRGERAILIVMGLTRHTTEPAEYAFTVTQP